jgi:signal transduction histidine kinase
MSVERQRECYQQITEQIQELSDLINDTLTITSADTVGMRFDPQTDDLERFCHTIINRFELTNIHRHQLILTAHTAGNVVSFDKKLLWQALNNLLSNAIKYSPGGGRIEMSLTCNSQHIQIQVMDNGMGIPEKDQKRIFEYFHRAANVGNIPGTGLGLVIARRAIITHGGELTFESREGQGTTFTITIPLAARDS